MSYHRRFSCLCVEIQDYKTCINPAKEELSIILYLLVSRNIYFQCLAEF